MRNKANLANLDTASKFESNYVEKSAEQYVLGELIFGGTGVSWCGGREQWWYGEEGEGGTRGFILNIAKTYHPCH